MPNHLVLVRHGESEGNFVRRAFRDGDTGYLNEEFRGRPGHEWRLTPEGVKQAQAAGEWIQEHIIKPYGLPGFDRHLYSPHRRTRETAAHLRLPGAQWRLNRLLREREWGELQWLVDDREHKQQYPNNYDWMLKDSLNWVPPGGESVAQISDTRVRELQDTLHRDHDEKGVNSVICVTHGEWMWASRLNFEYMFNEDWDRSEKDPTQKIHNGQVMHYTRLNPQDPSEQAPYLRWMRSVCPWKDEDSPGVWQESQRRALTNEELLEQVETLPRLFHD